MKVYTVEKTRSLHWTLHAVCASRKTAEKLISDYHRFHPHARVEFRVRTLDLEGFVSL